LNYSAVHQPHHYSAASSITEENVAVPISIEVGESNRYKDTNRHSPLRTALAVAAAAAMDFLRRVESRSTSAFSKARASTWPNT
jgi:hypothetical protein